MDSLSFLRAVSANLPEDLSQQFQDLRNGNDELFLENFIRFITGGSCIEAALDKERQEQWISKQMVVRNRLSELVTPANNKRQRDGADGADSNKRQKMVDELESSSDDPPIFTLKSISTTSPIRKKVDITIHKNSIRFHNPATKAIEHASPLSSLSRGFLVPTRGKTKPHWTVILISSDIPEKGKGTAGVAGNFQVIFGMDAVSTSATSVVHHTATSDEEIQIKKGDETLPHIRSFLSHLAFPVLQPSINVFKSALPSNTEGGAPGVEAYRGAKPGSLWFMKEGILWGDAKPCEFWPVGDLINKNEGLRMISATGRTCTLVLTRKTSGEYMQDEEDVGEEAQFGLIDAKEQDGINKWVKQYRHLFGKSAGEEAAPQPSSAAEMSSIKAKVDNNKPATLAQAQLDSDDEEDEDFEVVSEDDATASSSDEDSEGGGDEDAEGDGEDDVDEDGEADEDDGEELDPKHHPLLQPGAMPKMSRAAMDMVVDMVEGDLARAATGGESDAEEDELED
ncbi:negative regulator of dna transposition [Moniliophthora roreri]|nr:negative regulator of dna transposition [Moniliophthora roreri]